MNETYAAPCHCSQHLSNRLSMILTYHLGKLRLAGTSFSLNQLQYAAQERKW
jgi:hypothetical protein